MDEEFGKMIKTLDFKIMFVNEVVASDKMKDILKDNEKEDGEEKRYYVLSDGNKHAIIHYSGAISSARNIDKFNSQRLINDIVKCTKENSIRFD